jgi:hypothetical protein
MRAITLGAGPSSPEEAQRFLKLGGDWVTPEMATRWFGRMIEKMKDQPNWAQTLPRGTLRDTALAASFHAELEWNGDPSAADKVLAQIDNASLRRRITSTIAAMLSQDNPDAAFAYADKLPDETSRRLARQSIEANVPLSDELRLFAKQPDAWDITSLSRLAADWAKTSPTDAALAASRLNEPAKRAAMFDSVFAQWLKQSPTAASAWAQALPVGPARDDAAAAIAFAAVNEDAEGGMVWALSVNDANRRAAATDRAFAAWIQHDSEGALNWLNAGAAGASATTLQHLNELFAEASARPAKVGAFTKTTINGVKVYQAGGAR